MLLFVDANPFLQKVQRQLSSRLQRMPEMYSVTSVLDAWVSDASRSNTLNVEVFKFSFTEKLQADTLCQSGHQQPLALNFSNKHVFYM